MALGHHDGIEPRSDRVAGSGRTRSLYTVPAWPAVPPGDLVYNAPTGRGRPRIPAETPLASWLPLLPGLTTHGLRHGHETWMDEAAIPYVLQSDRMGHEVPGMRGVCSHISGTMRAGLVAALAEMWEASLAARARLSPRSAVGVLDELLAPYREPEQERFEWAAPKALPKIGHLTEEGPAASCGWAF